MILSDKMFLMKKEAETTSLSPIAKILLIVSVVVVIILAIIGLVFVNWRIRRIKKKYIIMDSKLTGIEKQMLYDENYGKIYFDIKEKTKTPLGDIEIQFLTNTVLKNQFKYVLFTAPSSEYEIVSTAKHSKIIVDALKVNDAKLINYFQAIVEIKNQVNLIDYDSKQNYDLIILNSENDFRDEHDKYFAQLNKNGLMVLFNANNFKSNRKKMFSYLKLIGSRYEFDKKSQGIIIIAK